MFLSARKAIKQQKNKEYEQIPKELLAALNKNVSDKFTYFAPDKTGAVAVLNLQDAVSSNEPILGVFKIDEIKEIPDAIKGMNFNEIQQYAYNTQKKIEIKFNGSMPKIIDKNREIPLVCRLYDGSPLGSSNCDSKLIIEPPPFRTRKIDVQVDDIIEKMDFIQEKSEDIYTYNYCATGKYFSFRLSFYIKTNIMDAVASIDLHAAIPIKDIIRTLKIYRGFCNRTMKLDGQKLMTALPDEVPLKINKTVSVLERDISWWEKIQRLEDVFHQEISLSHPLSTKQILTLEKLYIGLILNKAYISDHETVETLRITLKKPIDDSSNGKTVTFTLKQLQNLSLININRNIYDVIYLCNAKILKCSNLSSKKYEYEIKLGKYAEYNTYIAHQYFLTEQDAEQNLNSLPNNPMSLSQFDIFRT